MFARQIRFRLGAGLARGDRAGRGGVDLGFEFGVARLFCFHTQPRQFVLQTGVGRLSSALDLALQHLVGAGAGFQLGFESRLLQVGLPGYSVYSASKSGITGFTRALAVEWARFHINVNGIAPGAFSSEMMDGMLSRMGDFTGSFPRKRLGQPEQMDSTLLYLCDPASECVTGTVIKIDDGQGGR